MPWTFAHPAAVLPLRSLGGGRLSFAGLVIGSLTPDLGYYLAAPAQFSLAHTLPGLFKVCLPSGMVLYLLLMLMSRPVVQLLPSPHRPALLGLLPMAPLNSLRSVVLVVVSVLLGAATHLVWDSFTHVDGWMVERVSLLRLTLMAWEGGSLPVFKLMQHASSAFGAAVVILAYRRWLQRVAPALLADAQRSERWRSALIATLFGVAVVLGAVLAVAGQDSWPGGMRWSSLIVPWVVESTSVFVLALCVTAIVMSRRLRDA